MVIHNFKIHIITTGHHHHYPHPHPHILTIHINLDTILNQVILLFNPYFLTCFLSPTFHSHIINFPHNTTIITILVTPLSIIIKAFGIITLLLVQ